eukprot:6133125-Pyramimonas_sp.AAC.1
MRQHRQAVHQREARATVHPSTAKPTIWCGPRGSTPRRAGDSSHVRRSAEEHEVCPRRRRVFH